MRPASDSPPRIRTWHGTVEALELARLAFLGNSVSNAQQILMTVPRRLGNTVAVCRKSYIHPQVLSLVQAVGGDGTGMASFCESLQDTGRPPGGLQAAEWRPLNFLALPEACQRRSKAAA